MGLGLNKPKQQTFIATPGTSSPACCNPRGICEEDCGKWWDEEESTGRRVALQKKWDGRGSEESGTGGAELGQRLSHYSQVEADLAPEGHVAKSGDIVVTISW